MTKLLTGFWIIMGATVVVSVMVFLLRISQETIEVIGIFMTAGIGILIAGIVILFGASAWHKFRCIKAEADEKVAKSKAAHYVEYKDGFGMTHLLNLKTDTVENLSTYPGSHHNGHWEEPPQSAMLAWFALVSKSKDINKEVIQLPEPPQSLDLIQIMTQPTQSYAIIGGQQTGKTFQAIRIANHWLQSGIKPIVIGPKWDIGEWKDCVKFGGEYNFEKVNQGMRIVRKLAEDRHADKTQSHKQHPIQPIFFDDWTAVRAKLEKEAENFILDATTLYASINIVLYFIIHLDTANAWGVGKVGAALHQNFIKLFIEPGYNQQGLIDRSHNVGYILMPGQMKKDKQRVNLFSGNGSVPLLPDLIIQPSKEEALILKMANQPYHIISQAVWGEGKIGTFYNRKIDAILKNNGRSAL